MKQTIYPQRKRDTFRKKLAFVFIKIAYWIYPDSEDAKAFMCDIMLQSEMEKMKYGNSILEVKVKHNSK